MPEPDSTTDFSPERIILEANIREFGHTISMICALESGGKITPDQAYALIKKTWKSLKVSRKNLIGDDRGNGASDDRGDDADEFGAP